MRFSCLAALFLLLGLHGGPALADQQQERPRIGLVLSGGGARGGAHVGVLEVIEELDVPIDYVAGTSMGAIVGGLFASGYSAAQIQEILETTDWDHALSDDPPRKDRTMRTKEIESEFLIPYRIGFNKGRIELPLGAIVGQHLDQIFNSLLLPVANVKNFDDLPIPFRAVATDLETGEAVVLKSGSLPNALRASMSVPGVFAPVRIDGRLLVDGGMADNLPVSVVREMGADIVIAVDISTPLLTEDKLTSVLSVTEQLTNFLTRRNTEEQIRSLGPQDLLIVPPLGDFSSADFKDAGKIAKIGEEAAWGQRERLQAMSREATGAAAPAEPRLPEHVGEYTIAFIDLENNSVIDDRIILSRLGVKAGQELDLAALDRGVDEVYALDVFSSVTYDFLESGSGEVGLKIIATPRPWGPNYIQFGLELASDYAGASSYLLGAAYTRNALNRLGGELRVVGSLGYEDKLSFDFYQPIDPHAHWFVEPEILMRRTRYGLWIEETQVSQFEVTGWSTNIGIGRNLGLSDQLRLGYEFGRATGELLIGLPIVDLDQDIKIGELVPEYLHDSLDSPWFPTSGMQHLLRYRYADEAFGASADYQQLMARGSLAWTSGKNTMTLNYEGNYSFDDAAPVERWFSLGGLGRLSGLAPGQIFGQDSALLALAMYRRLNDVRLFPAYAGLTLETGNTWFRSEQIGFDDLRYSGSLFVGAVSPLGPVYFALGYNNDFGGAIYFYLGNPFKTANFE